MLPDIRADHRPLELGVLSNVSRDGLPGDDFFQLSIPIRERSQTADNIVVALGAEVRQPREQRSELYQRCLT